MKPYKLNWGLSILFAALFLCMGVTNANSYGYYTVTKHLQVDNKIYSKPIYLWWNSIPGKINTSFGVASTGSTEDNIFGTDAFTGAEWRIIRSDKKKSLWKIFYKNDFDDEVTVEITGEEKAPWWYAMAKNSLDEYRCLRSNKDIKEISNDEVEMANEENEFPKGVFGADGVGKSCSIS